MAQYERYYITALGVCMCVCVYMCARTPVCFLTALTALFTIRGERSRAPGNVRCSQLDDWYLVYVSHSFLNTLSTTSWQISKWLYRLRAFLLFHSSRNCKTWFVLNVVKQPFLLFCPLTYTPNPNSPSPVHTYIYTLWCHLAKSPVMYILYIKS